jgi:hypothetical protein
MAPPRKPCPYDTPDELRAAIVAAGSVDTLGHEIGASANTIRRWCREQGVDTRSGKTGRPLDVPYADAAEMEAALAEAGSLKALAGALGRDEKTVRRWMVRLGVESPEPGRRTDGGEFMGRLSDAHMAAMLDAIGPRELAQALGLNTDTVRREASRRGIAADPAAARSPRVAMLTRRVAELERQESAVADMMTAVRDAARDAVPTLPPVKRRPDIGSGQPVDVVCHVSDVQYGMVVDEDEVPGGGFSPDIVDTERLPRYLEAVRGILAATCSTRPLGTLWIAAGGDHVEGHDVFRGQSWHLALDAGEQVVRWGRLWARAVAELARMAQEHGGQSVLLAVNGNHGVQGGRGAGATPVALSYDYLAHALTCEALRHHADDLALTMHEEPRLAVYFQTCGALVLMTHGDQDRGGGLVGVPVVTGMRNDYSVRMSTGVQHDLHISGHYHRATSITVGADSERHWNSAWVGSTNLSIGRGGASLPSQNVFVIHPEYGMSALHRVRLVAGRTESPVEVLGP